MATNLDQLYETLLPAELRARDAAHGHALRDLLRVIAEQVAVVEGDIARQYDNLFIETCDDWVVPYLADVIGYRLGDGAASVIPARREVAQAIGYRRRRGALRLLAEIARDAAGWPARAVEFHTLVARACSLDRPHPERGRTLGLRDVEALARRGSAFDSASRSLELRSPGSRLNPGRYGLASVGLFVWTLRSRPVRQAPARLVEDGGHHCYMFNALGSDIPLFTRPAEAGGPVGGELDLPAAISRLAFREHLADYYGPGKSLHIWVGHEDGERTPIPLAAVVPADLSRWQEYRPLPDTVAVDPELGRMAFSPREPHPHGVWVSYYAGFSADMGGGAYPRKGLSRPLVAISRFHADDLPDPRVLADKLAEQGDPLSEHLWRCAPHELRAALAPNQQSHAPPEHLVCQALIRLLNLTLSDEALYADTRFKGVALPPEAERLAQRKLVGRALTRVNRLLLEAAYGALIAPSFRRYVVATSQAPAGDEQCFARLSEAVARWKADRPRHAEIVLADDNVSRGYGAEEPLTLTLSAQQSLALLAAPETRPMIRLVDYELHRPDYLAVHGEAGSALILDGLTITGQGIQISGELASVTIRHCTLVPGWALHANGEPLNPDGASLELYNTTARMLIDHSIVGSIQVNQDEVSGDPLPIEIRDSIVDATGPTREAIGAPTWPYAHAALTVLRSTVIGEVKTHSIARAEASIFGALSVRERQHGCIRFCYVAPGSVTPTRYGCQPDRAADRAEEDLRDQADRGQPQPTTEQVREARLRAVERVQPRFSSTRYGDPCYCRLSAACPEEVACGADGGQELGAFNELHTPQRLASLQARLAEYVPAGVDVGVVIVDQG